MVGYACDWLVDRDSFVGNDHSGVAFLTRWNTAAPVLSDVASFLSILIADVILASSPHSICKCWAHVFVDLALQCTVEQ